MTAAAVTYPRWRHHATEESRLVKTPDQEAEETPSADGWRDDKDFKAKPEKPEHTETGDAPQAAEKTSDKTAEKPAAKGHGKDEKK